mmetsp:Transcript_35725/g.101096  ORF Transcript_35725/g.101096 Transcript_35725/m.101096 type:complete len:376 (-) Transcript_35725:632-1759(-)
MSQILATKSVRSKGGASLRHGGVIAMVAVLLTTLTLLRVHMHQAAGRHDDSEDGMESMDLYNEDSDPVSDASLDGSPELGIGDKDVNDILDVEDVEAIGDSSGSPNAQSSRRAGSGRSHSRAGSSHAAGGQRSAGHGTRVSAASGGSLVGRLLGSAKSSILGSLRITSSTDPKISKKEAKDDAKRIEHEAKGLAKATGKMPEGLIVELSTLRGEKSEVVLDGNTWPKLGLTTTRACNSRGVPTGEGRKTCLCPALFSDAQCSTDVAIEKARTMVSWTGPYKENSIVCAANTVSKGQELRVARNPLGNSKADFLPRTILKVGSTFLPNLPSNDPFNGQVFRSCAVVGNGAVVLHGSRGKAIDAHSAVFRINNGPTK